jgi:hypothetical protein
MRLIACSIDGGAHISSGIERSAVMRLRAIWIGTCSVILLSACSDGMGPRVDKLRETLARSKVSLRESVVAAQSSVTGGKAVKAALLLESDPQYSVGALGNTTLHEVRVDIVSGSIVASRIIGASADPCPGSIPIADAIGIAEGRVSGSAVSIEPDDDDHCLREVQVLAGAILWEVKLARDGRVLEVEKSDDDGK